MAKRLLAAGGFEEARIIQKSPGSHSRQTSTNVSLFDNHTSLLLLQTSQAAGISVLLGLMGNEGVHALQEMLMCSIIKGQTL